MKARGYRVQVRVPHPSDEVWPLLTDTDQMNRAAGLPEVSYRPTTDPTGRPALLAEGVFYGFLRAKWLEYPFEWKENVSCQVRRVALGGPLREWSVRFRLEPADEGTRVHVEVEFVPAGRVGDLLVRLAVGPRAIADAKAQILRIADALAGRIADPFLRSRERVRIRTSRLEQKLRQVEADGVRPALLDRLGRHLTTAPDERVLHMRPFALADAWDEPRREVLSMFLHATRRGVVNLSWEVLCPSCRAARATFQTMRSLHGEAHCDTCNLVFGVDFDRLVELRFSVNAQIRRASAGVFCFGGPQTTPHILDQAVIEPGSVREWPVDGRPHILRVRARERPGAVRIFREEGVGLSDRAAVRLTDDGQEPALLTLPERPAVVAVENLSRQALTIVLEQEAWPTDMVSAALVSTLPEFRGMFSSEVLAPDVQVGIQNLAVLFSDLKASTAFYHAVGDARAFAVVREHFGILAQIVARHEGTFVKTIGDAVMAVFMTGPAAFDAALEMLRTIQEWSDPRVPDPATFIKLGVHQGPVIAVNLDERLDYFGSTVNMAARVQAQSRGGDIILSEAMMRDVGVAARLHDAGLREEPFVAMLPGFPEPVALCRLTASRP